MPWIKLAFDPNIGATSAQATDPQFAFHQAPVGLDDPNSPPWQDYTRPIPLHGTNATLLNKQPQGAPTNHFTIEMPSGNHHAFLKGNGADQPPIDIGEMPNAIPAPVAEYLTINLGDVIRYIASRTIPPHPLVPPNQDHCPPWGINLCSYPLLERMGDEDDRANHRYRYNFQMEPGTQLDFTVLVTVHSEQALQDESTDAIPNREMPAPLEADGLMVGLGRLYNQQQDLGGQGFGNIAEGFVAMVGAGDYERVAAGLNNPGRGKVPFALGGQANFVSVGEMRPFADYREDNLNADDFGRFPEIANTLNRGLVYGLNEGDRNIVLPRGSSNYRRTADLAFENARPVTQQFRFYVSVGALEDRQAMDTSPAYRQSFPNTHWARVSVDMPGPNNRIVTHAFERSPYSDVYPTKDGLRISPADVAEHTYYFPISSRAGEIGLMIGAISNLTSRRPVAKVEMSEFYARHYPRFGPNPGPEGNHWIKTLVDASPFQVVGD